MSMSRFLISLLILFFCGSHAAKAEDFLLISGRQFFGDRLPNDVELPSGAIVDVDLIAEEALSSIKIRRDVIYIYTLRNHEFAAAPTEAVLLVDIQPNIYKSHIYWKDVKKLFPSTSYKLLVDDDRLAKQLRRPGTFAYFETGAFAFQIDRDRDSLIDQADNCPGISNPEQTDTDGDGKGDACDADDDGDGVLDAEDNCPIWSNYSQADLDGDGLGDACDGDIDGDGVGNAADAFPYDATETDDTDGDGVGDSSDNCPTTPNANQADADGDGIGDACEAGDDDSVCFPVRTPAGQVAVICI
jgi:hypothetical protein